MMPLRPMDTAVEDLQQAEYPETASMMCPATMRMWISLLVEMENWGFGKSRIKHPYRMHPENVKTFRQLATLPRIFIKAKTFPIGIINCNWGGKSAACWIDEKVMAEHSELYQLYEEFAEKVSKVDEVDTPKWQRYVEQITNLY